MKIGHINLARSFNSTGEHFVALVEALNRQGVEQHIIVRNRALATRLAVYQNVTIGPVTGSPVLACCLMPDVDVVHVHDTKGARSGLLLRLTRSAPYVITRRKEDVATGSPIAHATVKRAAGTICSEGGHTAFNAAANKQTHVIADIARRQGVDFDNIANRAAAEHLRVYRLAADRLRVPAMLL